MNDLFTIGRRGFVLSLLSTGGALAFGTLRVGAAVISDEPWAMPAGDGVREFTPWITIGPDDMVVVRVTTPDIGNGVLTQAVSFVYEELGAKWENLKAEYASTSQDYAEDGVFSKPAGPLSYFSGRSTGPERMETYMTVAATAREQLKAAAAQQWGVAPDEVEAKDSVLTHAATGRSLRYGEVLEAAAAITLPEAVAPKPREAWTFLEKASPPKIQLAPMVRGEIVYGMDVKVPGKVYAALRQSPVMGGTVRSFDADAVMGMPGVLAVVEVKPTPPGEETTIKGAFPLGPSATQSAVAVIAEHYWQARTALDALPVEWDDGPGAKWTTTEMMNETALAAVDQPGEEVELSVGDVEAEFAKGGTIVEAKYLTPYCDQCMMEPLNGTALVTEDSVEVWQPSQHTQQAFAVAAVQSGVPQDKVTVHQTFVGGGFGRRVYSDDTRMVVAVAQQLPGRPVHTIWSREETMRQGRYRPLMAASMKARLGEDGLPTAILARMSGGPGFYVRGMGDTAVMQVVPNVQIESHVIRDFHVLTGPYRGPGYNSNIFFVETFLDECAVAAGQDPLDYRIKLYSKWADQGWAKCLTVLKEKSGWGETLPRGQARGVAIGNWGMDGKPDMGTTSAAVAKVEITPDGTLNVLQIDVAFDTGRVMNPDAVRAELEGGTIFGLNMALNEELNVENGRIVEGNYDQYPLIRIGDVPSEINVHFEGLTDAPRYNEIGEPPIGPIGPAVGNAIFQITGQRIRMQPLRKANLRWS